MKKDKWVYLKSCHRKGIWILSLGIILQGGLSLPATSMEMVKSQETGDIRDKKLNLPRDEQDHTQDKKYGEKEQREDLLDFPQRQVQKIQPLTERGRRVLSQEIERMKHLTELREDLLDFPQRQAQKIQPLTERERIIERDRRLLAEQTERMEHFRAITEKQDEIDGQMDCIENLLLTDFDRLSVKKRNYFFFMLADLLDERNAFVPELNRLSAEMGGIELSEIHYDYRKLYRKPEKEKKIPPLVAITTLGVAGGLAGWFVGLAFPLLSPFTAYAGAALLPVTYGGTVAAYNYFSSPEELPSIQYPKAGGKEQLLFQLPPAEGEKENTSRLLLE
jgi:hypothetical protein